MFVARRLQPSGTPASQLADPDVSKLDAVVVILQADMATTRLSVLRVVLELAALHAARPVVGPELVVDHLHAVHPMFDVRPAREQARLVPRADRPGGVTRGRIEIVVRAGEL